MARFRRQLSGTLILTFNFSLCTGGFLSMSSALASEYVPEQEQTANVQMSPVIGNNNTCYSSSLEHSRNHKNQGERHQNGCDDAEACLSHAHQSIIERGASIGSNDLEILPVFFDTDHLIHRNAPLPLTRDGPLFENASDYHRSLVKRE